ncbi:hypothetical protein WJX84_005132 [Apatococcus fuscideae]|uniref:dCMP deaminase n=1 Tax=Apatococcus fuscideae TaxID=2026836 RepID=A0AAW1STA4_9CHLO
MINDPSASRFELTTVAVVSLAGIFFVWWWWSCRQKPDLVGRQANPPRTSSKQLRFSCNTSPAPEGGKADPTDHRPRKSFLSWDDYFMAVAYLSSQRSKDPHKQVGACIVSTEQIILGIGYNGFPRGCDDAQLPWAKLSEDEQLLDTKYPYVCHAEMNAILNKNQASLSQAKLYVTMFPCNECAKLLIQAGIKEVIFHEDKPSLPSSTQPRGGMRPDQAYTASRRLLSLAGVSIRQHAFKQQLELMIKYCNILQAPQGPHNSHRQASRWRTSHTGRHRRYAGEGQSSQQDSKVKDDPAADGDLSFERQLKSRRNQPQRPRVNAPQVEALKGGGGSELEKMGKIEGRFVGGLALLFLVILLEGLFLAGSGFLPEQYDQFAQDVVFKTFTPSVGVLLAGSAAYGLWKSRQG